MSDSKYSKDERIDKISDLIIKYTTSNFNARESISGKGDELDAIILGLNTLGEELETSGRITVGYQKRINAILEILLQYTLMDFSKKAEISEQGDEVDAIALGLNTLAEELDASKRDQKKYTDKLKESEEKFRLLVESVKDYAIYMIDAKGYIMSWNQGAERIKGYSADEVIGKHISLFYTPEEIHRKEPELNLEFAKKNSRYEAEGWRLRKDGSRFWADIVFNALYDEDNNLKGFAKVTRDISERKQAEEQIAQLNKELEKKVAQLEVVNKELDAFSYSVSHDLRAPLRAIHGYTKILSNEYVAQLGDDAKKMMDNVMRNAKKMGRLIDDLLSFSRIGKRELQKTVIDMKALAEASLKELTTSLPELKSKIIIHPLPPANGDYNLIAQVFVNLLSNAIKYSGKKENPLVEVGSFNEQNETIYYVKDNGIGFDMQYYDKLFGVFQRLNGSEEFEGTGVGLALVKRIIIRHGGKIWAEGKTGEGAIFYFSLNSNN